MGKGEQREREAFLRNLDKWNRVVVKEPAGKTVEGSGESDRPEGGETPDRQTFIVVKCDTAKSAPDAKLA